MTFWLSKAWSPHHLKGTWCSGITPAQHAGGPGFNPQRVHGCLSDSISQQSARLASGGSARFWKECISRESNPGHIDGNDVFCHLTTDALMGKEYLYNYLHKG